MEASRSTQGGSQQRETEEGVKVGQGEKKGKHPWQGHGTSKGLERGSVRQAGPGVRVQGVHGNRGM